jgi:hypothetical protein
MSNPKSLGTAKGMLDPRTIARMLFGPNTQKQLQLELGCTGSQAWCIVSHGHVPAKLTGSWWNAV